MYRKGWCVYTSLFCVNLLTIKTPLSFLLSRSFCSQHPSCSFSVPFSGSLFMQQVCYSFAYWNHI
ncbi:hypothetical protein FLA_4159 [Filimonas lacunae]|nr:hypothetical protein FLA_4159 [Filimonas lacunae]